VIWPEHSHSGNPVLPHTELGFVIGPIGLLSSDKLARHLLKVVVPGNVEDDSLLFPSRIPVLRHVGESKSIRRGYLALRPRRRSGPTAASAAASGSQAQGVLPGGLSDKHSGDTARLTGTARHGCPFNRPVTPEVAGSSPVAPVENIPKFASFVARSGANDRRLLSIPRSSRRWRKRADLRGLPLQP
jgi:hypothetical protein